MFLEVVHRINMVVVPVALVQVWVLSIKKKPLPLSSIAWLTIFSLAYTFSRLI